MVLISKQQAQALSYVIEHPWSTLTEIRTATGISVTSIPSVMMKLLERSLVERMGVDKHYKYKYTGLPYEINTKKFVPPPPKKAEVSLDGMLQDLVSIELTDDQLIYLRGHTHLPRRELSRKLGISKLELNQYMDRNGIKSKHKPIREEQ